MRYDEQGWALDPIAMGPLSENYSLLSPEPDGRLDAAQLSHRARRFFSCELSLHPAKRYPGGGSPRSDAAELTLRAAAGAEAQVVLVTLPLARAPSAKQQAERAAEAMGGAGMDVLVGRATRLWQVATTPLEGDPRLALLAAAVLSSLLLGPVLPPEGGVLFGVRGARERLERLGLRC